MIVTNNLYFGHEYKDINRLFVKYQNISDKCRKCRIFLSGECRGLMNKKFAQDKNILIKKIGLDTYQAVKSDYENCAVAVGSGCSQKCRFCFDGLLPKEILRVVPFLTPSEVVHFLHFSPHLIDYISNTFHCKSGEISESPYFADIMRLFMDFSNYLFIVTNGSGIDQKMVNLLKNKNLTVSISMITLNAKCQKQFMSDKKPRDYMKTIKMLQKSNIAYNIGLIPFKSLITSQDIFSTIDQLLKNDPDCSIRIQIPSANVFMNEQMKNELDIDYPQFKKDIKARYPDKNIWYCEETFPVKGELMHLDIERLEALLNNLKNKMRKICASYKRSLVLCPDRTFQQMRNLSSKNIKVVKVNSLLGYSSPCAGVLRVEDYLAVLSEQTGTFDCVIIPQNTFDVNFDDFSLIGVNRLWAQAQSVSKSIIFI